MQLAGYEIRQGKHLSFRAPEQKNFTYMKSLGSYYSEENVRIRLAKNRSKVKTPKHLSREAQQHISDVDASVKASVFWPFLFVTVITIGEMCFSPLRNAFVSKYAPKKYLSLLMGVIAISTFGANKLSPFVQAFIEKFDVFPVFVGITVIMLVFTALIFLANKKLNSLVEGKEEA